MCSSKVCISIENIEQLTNIKVLNLWSCKSITDNHMKILINITDLNLCSNDVITDDGIMTRLVQISRV